jgi:deazaflavin-dependent oxidoreductase (nitroreductase family)
MDPIAAADKVREVTLTTTGRKSGKARRVTIWITTDCQHIYVRSGQGLARDWPRNLLANNVATLRLGVEQVKVRARHVTDPVEAHATSALVRKKYGVSLSSSKGEQAVFELIPV